MNGVDVLGEASLTGTVGLPVGLPVELPVELLAVAFSATLTLASQLLNSALKATSGMTNNTLSFKIKIPLNK